MYFIKTTLKVRYETVYSSILKVFPFSLGGDSKTKIYFSIKEKD